MKKIDIAAAHARNPNYRSDFNARLEKLKKTYGMEDKKCQESSNQETAIQ